MIKTERRPSRARRHRENPEYAGASPCRSRCFPRLKPSKRDLRDLDARLQAIVARNPAKPLFASHPVYQYLARRYSLNLKSVLWEPDAVAPAAEWRALADLRKEHPATWMVWEGDPAPENRERLQQLGVQSTVFDPCGNRPAVGDFLSVMADNVANLARVFDDKTDNEGG